MQIYIHRNGQQLGPFTEAEIKSQLASGAISPQDNAWWEGQAGWVPLGQSSLAASLALPASYASQPNPPETTSTLAIVSLILGILGVGCYPTSVLFFLPAVICGHLALSKIKKNPQIKGWGLAIAGLVLGYVQLLIVCLLGLSIIIALTNQPKSVFTTITSQLNYPSGTGNH